MSGAGCTSSPIWRTCTGRSRTIRWVSQGVVAAASPRTRISGVDGMRALAAIAVFLCHLVAYWRLQGQLPGKLTQLAALGAHGVDLFVVISGFCLALPVARRLDLHLDVRKFFIRRSTRILPPYYVALALCAALAMAPATADKVVEEQASWGDVLLHVALLQTLVPGHERHDQRIVLEHRARVPAVPRVPVPRPPLAQDQRADRRRGGGGTVAAVVGQREPRRLGLRRPARDLRPPGSVHGRDVGRPEGRSGPHPRSSPTLGGRRRGWHRGRDPQQREHHVRRGDLLERPVGVRCPPGGPPLPAPAHRATARTARADLLQLLPVAATRPAAHRRCRARVDLIARVPAAHRLHGLLRLDGGPVVGHVRRRRGTLDQVGCQAHPTGSGTSGTPGGRTVSGAEPSGFRSAS